MAFCQAMPFISIICLPAAEPVGVEIPEAKRLIEFLRRMIALYDLQVGLLRPQQFCLVQNG